MTAVDPAAAAGQARVRALFAHSGHPPTLSEDALYGLAGEIVRALAPLTEASPAAMLLTLLCGAGAMVGRGAYIEVGSARHFPAIFATIVGSSAKARKGTSLAALQPIFAAAGDDAVSFLERRVIAGIGSGEALVQTIAQGGDPTVTFGDDRAAADQRVWVIEEEFAKILTVGQRSESTLSSVLREAWDGQPLQNRTKRGVICAREPHLGLLAHVTAHDLTGLSAANIGNGFGNRFLYVYSARTALLPEPGQLTRDQVSVFGERLMKAIDAGRRLGPVRRTPAFRTRWDGLYREVESRTGGPRYDQLTARATAQMLRLALIFSILDECDVLDAPHLTAAAAVWEYCEATVAHLWGMSLGNPTADKLHAALREAGDAGLTRTQIRGCFSNNLSAARIDQALALLVDGGFVCEETRATGGRPSLAFILAPPPVDPRLPA